MATFCGQGNNPRGGDMLQRLLQSIDSCVRAGKFQKPPLGPLGSLLTLTDDRCAENWVLEHPEGRPWRRRVIKFVKSRSTLLLSLFPHMDLHRRCGAVHLWGWGSSSPVGSQVTLTNCK